MLEKIQPAVKSTRTEPGEERNSGNTSFVNKVAEKNVELNKDEILVNSSVIREMYNNGEIDIVGAMYDVKTGKVTFDH
jgi:carbonic anhydrase